MGFQLPPALVLIVAAATVAVSAPGCTGLSRGARFLSRGLGPLFSTPAPPPVRIEGPVAVPGARLAATWIGHATVLLQLDDKFVLTDPVFTDTVGQLSRRLVAPGLEPDRLPPLDAVVVSHLHFDHLSLGSLELIEEKARRLFVPEGGLVYVPDFRFDSIELRKWQTWERDGLRITAVPVQHFGFRYAGDRDWMTASFTGYVIEYHGLRVFFGGDTGYSETLFKETGARFPGIDLSVLPIAPIEPRDFMRYGHVDPAEALKAHADLGARAMLPMHYDTFVNSTDTPDGARAALAQAMAARPDLRVVPLRIGERKVFR